MSLIEIIQDCIDKWDLVGLNSEINKEENVKWIEKNAWDLVPVLLFPATEENLSKCPHIVHACSKILQDPISKIGNPKELIIALLGNFIYITFTRGMLASLTSLSSV